MNGLGAGAAGGFEQFFHRKIALRRRRRAEVIRLVGKFDVERFAIGVGVDGNGRDPHFARRANYANGNLAAIGDQELVDHLLQAHVGGKRPIA